jgi:hypothetical protein
VVTVTMVGGGYRALLESLTVIAGRANSAKELRSGTLARLYVYDTLLRMTSYPYLVATILG